MAHVARRTHTTQPAPTGNGFVLLPATPPATATLTATAGQRTVAATIGWGLVNPKKPGTASAARFALYQPGQTQAAYVAACVAAGHSRRNATADWAWDLQRGFIAPAQ